MSARFADAAVVRAGRGEGERARLLENRTQDRAAPLGLKSAYVPGRVCMCVCACVRALTRVRLSVPLACAHNACTHSLCSRARVLSDLSDLSLSLARARALSLSLPPSLPLSLPPSLSDLCFSLYLTSPSPPRCHPLALILFPLSLSHPHPPPSPLSLYLIARKPPSESASHRGGRDPGGGARGKSDGAAAL